MGLPVEAGRRPSGFLLLHPLAESKAAVGGLQRQRGAQHGRVGFVGDDQILAPQKPIRTGRGSSARTRASRGLRISSRVFGSSLKMGAASPIHGAIAEHSMAQSQHAPIRHRLRQAAAVTGAARAQLLTISATPLAAEIARMAARTAAGVSRRISSGAAR